MDIVEKIRQLENEIKELRSSLEIITLHPSIGYILQERMGERLLKNNWIRFKSMIAFESWGGYGEEWVKSKSQLTDWDRVIAIKKYDYYSVE
jgi:hypothetical protein